MKLEKNFISIKSYYQALEILKIYENSNKIPTFYIKYNLINRLSVDWLLELIKMLETQFGTGKFKTCVEVKKNYGLFINLVQEKINYIEVHAEKEILKKLKSIAKVNKVLINPNFSILDATKVKNKKN